jgi:DNA replication initiation complex subunit (GINS family)
MTTTSQALSGTEATRYKNIKKRFETLDRDARKKLTAKQGRIVQDAIKKLPQNMQNKLNTEIANLIKARIFGKRDFEPPE